MGDKFEFSAIGFFHGGSEYKWSAPRQGVHSQSSGYLELKARENFEQALQGIEGFRRIWLVYVFHQNESWKPMVRPQNSDCKVGVFASRAPYRPNPLGLTCAVLEKVEGLKLWLSEVDLLDGTPILDVKPYIPYADEFSADQVLNEGCWWQPTSVYSVGLCEEVSEQLDWLRQKSGFDLTVSIQAQLSTQPTDMRRKRVVRVEAGWQLALRTWRVLFTVDESRCAVTVRRISSGLSEAELQNKAAEWPGEENSPALHIGFLRHFSN